MTSLDRGISNIFEPNTTFSKHSYRQIRPERPNMIFLQSVVINLVVAFLIFVSFYARKTDRRLNSLVVPVHLPLPTPIATIEIRESAPTSCQPVPNRESRNKSYHIKRQSKDPYTFFRIGNQESKRSNESEGITAQCQMFLSNFDSVFLVAFFTRAANGPIFGNILLTNLNQN